MYLSSSVSSTKSYINIGLAKVRTVSDTLSITWKSNQSDKIKRNFFEGTVGSILLHGCTTGMLTKHLQKKLDGNCTKMLRAILNKYWKQSHKTAAAQPPTSHL